MNTAVSAYRDAMQLPQTASAPLRSSQPSTEQDVTQEEPRDRIDLSSTGRRMNQLLLHPDQLSPEQALGGTGPERAKRVQEQIAADLAAFKEKFSRYLQEEGYLPESTYRITATSDGDLQVQGTRDDRDALSGILAEHPDLERPFDRLRQNSRKLQLSREAGHFQEAYRQSPQGAVRRYQHLMDPAGLGQFAIQVDGEEMAPIFQNGARAATLQFAQVA